MDSLDVFSSRAVSWKRQKWHIYVVVTRISPSSTNCLSKLMKISMGLVKIMYLKIHSFIFIIIALYEHDN